MAPNGAAGGGGALLDTRLLRDLEQCDGGAKGWRDLSVIARSHFACVDQRLKGPMTRAETEVELDVALINWEPGMLFDCRRHHTLLIHSCKGGALDRVINAGPGEGLPGGKDMVAGFEPRQRTIPLEARGCSRRR